MKLHRLAWAVWASLPVAAMAYHYGPGQAAFQNDRAASLQDEARDLEQQASELQAIAYAAHLKAIEARNIAEENPTADNEAKATQAAKEESRTFQESSAAWRDVADAYGEIQAVAENATLETLCAVRWSRSRALVRAGDVWSGIGELESILTELEQQDLADDKLAVSTREELATAYYYAARLRRLSGDAAEEWMVESGKARQHFRYLAQLARTDGGDEAKNYERDVEHVLNLEQSALVDIQGKPLPKDSPLGCTGDKPSNCKNKSKRPPNRRDGRGAGGAAAVNEGW